MKQWYRPREIAKLGLILNSKGTLGTESSRYSFITKLILDGKLRAKDYSKIGSKPYWLVSAKEIERYNNGA